VDKTVVFGPWFGEFGWELPRWNPACRYLANTKYKDWHKIVVGPKGHKIIYEFADEYVDIEDVEYVSNMYFADFKKGDPKKYKLEGDENVRAVLVDVKNQFKIEAKRFQGTKCDELRDRIKRKIIVIFPRQRSLNPQRNWGRGNWTNLAKHYINSGYHVMSFGGPEDEPLNLQHSEYTSFMGYNGSDELDYCISALNIAECGVAIQSGGIYISMYSCKRTAAFGIELHRKRLAGEDYLKSNYRYITYAKHWRFPMDFMIKKIDSVLELPCH
jgi:ADP-heptose:LPS heptosyltransferase